MDVYVHYFYLSVHIPLLLSMLQLVKCSYVPLLRCFANIAQGQGEGRAVNTECFNNLSLDI